MHDWQLLNIFFDWKQGVVILELVEYKEIIELRATGVIDLRIPRHREWGPSVFINEAALSDRDKSGNMTLNIGMQTGDKLKITANEFVLPEGF
ncbi:hypothetical protein [Kiloniella antarctica]|uniref:Uncharacterized protein n=1 Tax=Kiloniella antarctica TaxID=1550907 RepID=A0ABW5BJB5_9PROT